MKPASHSKLQAQIKFQTITYTRKMLYHFAESGTRLAAASISANPSQTALCLQDWSQSSVQFRSLSLLQSWRKGPHTLRSVTAGEASSSSH